MCVSANVSFMGRRLQLSFFCSFFDFFPVALSPAFRLWFFASQDVRMCGVSLALLGRAAGKVDGVAGGKEDGSGGFVLYDGRPLYGT